MNAMRRENAASSAPKIGPAVMIEDPFDPSNQQATLIQQHMSDNNAVDHMDPPGSDYAAEYDDPNKSHPIRLASKTILSHLVNHLFHFPMCAGRKSALGSLLLACSIHSPNLLTFFILKKTQKKAHQNDSYDTSQPYGFAKTW